jgi:ParB-like chromosome segregation protein Spo0J
MKAMEDIKAWEERPWVPYMNEAVKGWKELPVESIRPDPVSIHVANRYAEAERTFGPFVESISHWGMGEAFIVAENGSGDYLIIDGVRRYRAALRLGLKKIICLVYYPLTDDARQELRARIYFHGRELKNKARAELKAREKARSGHEGRKAA